MSVFSRTSRRQLGHFAGFTGSLALTVVFRMVISKRRSCAPISGTPKGSEKEAMASVELALDDRKASENAMKHVVGSLAILGSTESFPRSIAMPSTKRLLELAIK